MLRTYNFCFLSKNSIDNGLKNIYIFFGFYFIYTLIIS